MFRQKLVLSVDAVAIVEVLREFGRIGWGRGLAIAEHGGNNDMMGGKDVVAFGECESGVDSTTIASGYADSFRGGGVVGAVCDADGEYITGGEGERGDIKVFNAR